MRGDRMECHDGREEAGDWEAMRAFRCDAGGTLCHSLIGRRQFVLPAAGNAVLVPFWPPL